MSLPASQQRVLDRIEEALKKREPRLASMFAMFTRLNIGELLPRIEALETVPWWAPRRYRQRVPARAMIFLSLAIALIVSAVFIGTSQSPVNCRTPLTPHGSLIGVSHAGAACNAPDSKTMGLGHGP
jgi:Protein of unknown function (DUF3040)